MKKLVWLRYGRLLGAIIFAIVGPQQLLASSAAETPKICDWHSTQTRLSVVAGAVSNLVTSADEGIFVDLLKRISKRTPFEFDIDVHSDKRAQRHFTDRHYDAYMLWSNFDPPMSALKVHLASRSLHAVVRRGDPIPTEIGELEGLRIGLPFVYSFPDALVQNKKIHTLRLAESVESNIEALMRGRVDVTIVARDAADAMALTEGAEHVVFDPAHPLFTKEIYIVLQPDQSLECTAKMLQAEISSMRSDGSLREILGKLDQ